MYIPKLNVMDNRDEIVAFMKRFSFATIITIQDSVPVASHLPFIVSIEEGNVILRAHFAKANDQWKQVTHNKVLVIFSEPHAYISPANYETELNVPTWNYISIHAYGSGKLLTANEDAFKILEDTIDNYETTYKAQWNSFPETYKLKMVRGIVAFEITVTDLQGKKKLSQNRTATEQQAIINKLSTSTDTNEQMVAEYMKDKLHS